ncbi:GNAT family N-acetyltransferase [Collinsella vaginalis]|uniref:GNAT family N-acetyltransferase n=1 Tax=Collinsella vaginalis TaxID=1870987 RepID=UPI000A26A9AD|nr:GNAT family N-acetyltransferase [Collinsella vaginalis]
MEQRISIRQAIVSDAAALAAIYAPYVEHTAITFENEPPTVDEFAQRMADTLKRYPYLVAEGADGPVGYAYAGPFGSRAAYDWSIETSIYVAEGHAHEGIGRALHEALERELAAMGIKNMYACIAVPEVADEHLTRNSAEFHEHLGYRLVGTFKKCGSKFGRWYDMVWMERIIGEHEPDPVPPRWRAA